MWWLAIAAFAAAFGYYWYLIRPYRFWTQRGVKQVTGISILRDSWGGILGLQSLNELVEMQYNMFPKTRYSGFYQFFLPTLMLKDADLIKQITVRDFDHFVDRHTLIPEDIDPLWAKNLVSLTGQKWRDMRTVLSPAFTSSKMKYMFSFMSQNGEQFVNYFLKKKEDIITIEMKDIFTRFTNDVIANTAFGVECDSLDNRDNEFFLMGKEATDFNGFWKMYKFVIFLLVPRLCKLLGISFFTKEAADFFNRVVKTNIESRVKHGTVRPDMLHLLLEARKDNMRHEEPQPIQDSGFATVEESEVNRNPIKPKLEITDQDITSQALIFFFAGFHSVSSLMSFMSYELAVNPDIQQRLIREVDATMEACDGKLRYEALLGMKYMDMVTSETLRKWPNSVVVDRVCTKPYTIEPKYQDEKPIHLEKGVTLWLPIFSLHRDPQYYPDPGHFDPERFNEENKTNIKPYSYVPFGSGPRNCIGSRFALLETKTLFVYILSHFEIIPIEKTQIPPKIDKRQLSLAAEGGMWLGLKRRVKTYK